MVELENHFFSPLERQQFLEKLHNALSQDPRILGAVLVGSAAVGFADRFSDIDIYGVVADGVDAKSVFEDWIAKIRSLRPVIRNFSSQPSPDVWLAGFLFEDYLELDISFQTAKRLNARKEKWQVLFDRSGELEDRMKASWENREVSSITERYTFLLNDIWYYIVHTVVCSVRGHSIRAAYYLNFVRDFCVKLAGLLESVETNESRQAHLLSSDFKDELERTLIKSFEQAELQQAVLAGYELFFRLAAEMDQRLGENHSGRLAEQIREYLTEWESGKMKLTDDASPRD